jgi:C4-dicarboxylate-binding protein DctP
MSRFTRLRPVRLLSMLSVLSVATALSGITLAQPASPIVIKFSHVVAADAPKGKAADRFKQLAEERTKGRVKIEVYPNSQLYKDKEEMEALQLGAVQMLAPSLAKFGPLGVKEFEVFDLPFLFSDEASFHRVVDGPVGQALLKKLEPKGVKGLAFWDNAAHVMTTNKPLRRPSDLKGLKMRIQSSKVLDAQMRAFGAIPQVMAASEVYQGLQTGVIDGSEGVPSGIFTQKIHEVQKHITLSNHGHLAYVAIVNKSFWDGLPPDIRATLEGAMKDATAYANDIARKENEDALAKMKASGKTTIYALTDAEREEWKRVQLPVHAAMAGRIGQETIQAVYKAAGFTGK